MPKNNDLEIFKGADTFTVNFRDVLGNIFLTKTKDFTILPRIGEKIYFPNANRQFVVVDVRHTYIGNEVIVDIFMEKHENY